MVPVLTDWLPHRLTEWLVNRSPCGPHGHLLLCGLGTPGLLCLDTWRQSKLDFNAPSTEALLKSLAHYYKLLTSMTRLVRRCGTWMPQSR